MRPLIVSGIVLLAGAVIVIFAWPKTDQGPVAFVYGRDVCQRCRMHISRSGFGAELRDAQGVLTKYDDIGCMLLAMHEVHREFPEVWVEDHAGAGLMSLLSATLVRGKDLGTPMGYGVLAFKHPEAAASYARNHQAEIVPLEILLKDRERFAPRSAQHSEATKGFHP